MTRIRQFAKDMSISYNDAKKLVDKGKKRKDGGSNILENYMPIVIVPTEKKKVPMPKPRPKNLKKKDPFRADKTESLDREFSKSVAKQNERNMKNVKKKRDGGIEYGDIPGGKAIRQRAGEKHGDIPGGRAKKKKKPESPKTIHARGGGMAIQGTGFRGVR